LELLKFLTIGTVKRVKLCHRAKFRGDRSNRYGDIAIFRFFQDCGHRRLGFFEFQISVGRNGQECRTASSCKISWRSMQDGAACHLGFFKFGNCNGRNSQTLGRGSRNRTTMWADVQRDGRPPNIAGALCESSVIPFFVPRRSLADACCWSAVQ